MDFFRDPIWQFVGVVITLFTFIFTIILEWPTVKARFGNKIATPPKFLFRIISGTIGGITSGLIGGYVFSLLFNEIGWGLDMFNSYQNYSLWDVLLWGVGWGIAGLIFSLIDVQKSSSFLEGLSGAILGSLLAMPVGLLTGYIVSSAMWGSNRFAVTVEISSSIGASVSMFLFGFIYGGFMKQVAKILFRIWIRDN